MFPIAPGNNRLRLVKITVISSTVAIVPVIRHEITKFGFLVQLFAKLCTNVGTHWRKKLI
jgi:hypothetical protein